MSSVTDWVSTSSGLGVYAVVGALVFCEDALFFGFVLPGETAVVLGGVVASQGRVSVYWMCAVVVFAAIAGDSVGYEVGNRFGPRILETKALRGHRERIGKAEELIRRRGPAAVFLGRFVAFFRALMPALAGISRMPYRVFLAYNAAGGLVWGVGFTLLGYYAGDAYKRVERTAGTAVAVVVAVIVVAAFVYWEIRRHRKPAGEQEQDGGSDGDGEGGAGGDGGFDGADGSGGDGGSDGSDGTDGSDDGNGSEGAGGGDGSGRPGRPDGPGGSHRLDGDGRSEHDGAGH